MRYRKLIAGLCLIGSLGCETEGKNKPEGQTKDLVQETYSVSISGKSVELEIGTGEYYCGLSFGKSNEYLLLHDHDCDGTTDSVFAPSVLNLSREQLGPEQKKKLDGWLSEAYTQVKQGKASFSNANTNLDRMLESLK